MSVARTSVAVGVELSGQQRDKLSTLLAAIGETNRFYQAKLAGARFDARRDPLETLPFTTRAEIQQDQIDHPPYGTNLTYPLERYTRMHQTSGSTGVPLRWLDTPESWRWWKRCWDRVYDGAGVTPADRVVFPFSFGPFVGFWSAFECAAERGCLCLPAGGMSTPARLRFLVDNAATIVCCTPTYALHMAEAAAKERIDLMGSPVRALIVAGEPGGSIPETRARIESAWGARVFDHAGMTEIGAWGYETADGAGGLFVNEDEFIAETIDPATLVPIADGDVGELVLTNLGRTGSPLIRYRTGDLVRLCRHGSHAVAPPAKTRAPQPLGSQTSDPKIPHRQAACPGGVLGRVDDMLFVRGNNVFPAAIEGILRGVAGVAEYRLTVAKRGVLSELVIEVEPVADADGTELARRVTEAIRDQMNFRPDVRAVAAGTLPRFEMKARRIVRNSESEERS